MSAASWLTVNVAPATVIVPVRGFADVLAETVKFTAPLPVRLVFPLMVIQLALLLTVHVHPLVVVTVVLPLPPDAATLCDDEERAKLQAAACETVTTWPATVNVPVRAVPELAATV